MQKSHNLRVGDAKLPHRNMPADQNSVGLGRLQDALGFNLRLAQEAAFRAFAHRVGDPDLKPRRYAMLSLIDENPGLTQAQLGRASARDKSSVTPALKDLLHRGLVERRQVQHDKRVYVLRLTPKGGALLHKLHQKAREHDGLIEESIGTENRAAFLCALRTIAATALNYVQENEAKPNRRGRK